MLGISCPNRQNIFFLVCLFVFQQFWFQCSLNCSCDLWTNYIRLILILAWNYQNWSKASVFLNTCWEWPFDHLWTIFRTQLKKEPRGIFLLNVKLAFISLFCPSIPWLLLEPNGCAPSNQYFSLVWTQMLLKSLKKSFKLSITVCSIALLSKYFSLTRSIILSKVYMFALLWISSISFMSDFSISLLLIILICGRITQCICDQHIIQSMFWHFHMMQNCITSFSNSLSSIHSTMR